MKNQFKNLLFLIAVIVLSSVFKTDLSAQNGFDTEKLEQIRKGKIEATKEYNNWKNKSEAKEVGVDNTSKNSSQVKEPKLENLKKTNTPTESREASLEKAKERINKAKAKLEKDKSSRNVSEKEYKARKERIDKADHQIKKIERELKENQKKT